jgi:quercetin dioxygenase-like cupin family protein
MSDAIPPVDLASLAAAGGHPGARWRLDGEDLQANLVRLDQGDRIAPHRNDEVEVLVMVVSGRGELTVDGQVHQLAPMIVASLPKGTVRAVEAVDGPLAYLSVHRRRPAGLQLGRPGGRGGAGSKGSTSAHSQGAVGAEHDSSGIRIVRLPTMRWPIRRPARIGDAGDGADPFMTGRDRG